MSILNQVYNLTDTQTTFNKITVGTVVDTDDPQQNGRVRVVCLALNDYFTDDVENIPWASYASPLGGTFQNGVRGPNDDVTTGSTSYGMWGVPKIGAQVLVACIDGNPLFRVWLGCLYESFTPHTMPHGRYVHTEAKSPEGPVSSANAPIQPLYDNLTKAFTSRSHNYEWRTRAADRMVSAVNNDVVHLTQSPRPDDEQFVLVEEDGNVESITQGYQPTSTGIGDDTTAHLFEGIKDSHIYSWTTPGFHSISMDDSGTNCRMRFRTSSGHQIIMDDTNERVYINTAEGNNWIELDQNGNIDIFSSRRISIHAEKDINFASDQSIRFHAAKGIHMYSGAEIALHAMTDISARAESDMALRSYADLYIQSGADLNIKSGGSLFAAASSNIDVLASSNVNITSSSAMNIKAGGNLIASGSQVHFNGPPASSASDAADATDQPAKFVNRLPQHEPWARVLTESDFTLDPALPYNDPSVGKVEGADTIIRNPNWHR